jgi:hypothetical protein
VAIKINRGIEDARPAYEYFSGTIEIPRDLLLKGDFTLEVIDWVLAETKAAGAPPDATVNWGGGRVYVHWKREVLGLVE